MAYTVSFTSAAAKSIEKLEHSILRRIKSKLSSLEKSPRSPGAIKLAGQSDLYRVRVGSYRVVYRIDDAAQTVEIALVADRRDVYRSL